MSQPIPAEPNRDVADDEQEQELAQREPSADPGEDAAETMESASETAGD